MIPDGQRRLLSRFSALGGSAALIATLERRAGVVEPLLREVEARRAFEVLPVEQLDATTEQAPSWATLAQVLGKLSGDAGPEAPGSARISVQSARMSVQSARTAIQELPRVAPVGIRVRRVAPSKLEHPIATERVHALLADRPSSIQMHRPVAPGFQLGSNSANDSPRQGDMRSAPPALIGDEIWNTDSALTPIGGARPGLTSSQHARIAQLLAGSVASSMVFAGSAPGEKRDLDPGIASAASNPFAPAKAEQTASSSAQAAGCWSRGASGPPHSAATESTRVSESSTNIRPPPAASGDRPLLRLLELARSEEPPDPGELPGSDPRVGHARANREHVAWLQPSTPIAGSGRVAFGPASARPTDAWSEEELASKLESLLRREALRHGLDLEELEP